MSRYLDSSVLVASLLPDDPDFQACDHLLSQPGNWTSPHALNETFATLTGGRLGARIRPDSAATLISLSIFPCVRFVALTAEEIVAAQANAKSLGVRGGAIYDFMHLKSARKAQVLDLVTLNVSDFDSIHREGDPEIHRP